MLDAYQRNSKRYLTFTACRSVLRGDVCCLMRIYNFISSQNLINYGVSFDGNYAFRPSPTDKALQQCVRPQLGVARAPQASDNLKSKTVDSDNLTLTAISKHFTRIYRVYCSECKLICGVVWFAEVRNEERQKNICFECFNRMGLEKSNEYVKVDIIKRM